MAASTPVDRLASGDHACLTFSDPEERLDILAAFVAAGQSRGEEIICFTDAVGVDELRAELLERGIEERGAGGGGAHLRVVRADQLWGGGSAPEAATMVELLAGELRRALERGRSGLRITADMCWAARPQANAEQLLVFESEVARLFADGRLTAICEYDRESFDPVTLGYASRVHARTVAARVYHEDAVLRICRQHVPPGVRVAGDLDRTRADALRDALAEAVRLDPDIHLNLNQLHFLDPSAAEVILRTAANLPDRRRMVVVCAEPVERTLIEAGAARVPALRMLVRHGER
ncbi:MEDS domain-containing protein [Couchioplanes caeruleus]|uniref:MEDS domain-containing protein n=1 Tax=Couchioplanes caeruleus TaxID=56438 RepID=UPI0020BDD36D|nr:MEDS domain-containing protein [Couchioplanes caeruleus]UQU64804.1 MEDS domain-containing protein [Couchioplanes caeruleus]